MLTRKTQLLGRTAVFASLTVLALGALTSTAAEARHLRWHGGGAAAAGFAAAAVGTGLAIAASRDAYAYDQGYDEGPAYYDAPAYYSRPAPYGYYRAGDYPYQVYGGDSPYTACAQGTTWNCR
jgi:hypothetical protein